MDGWSVGVMECWDIWNETCVLFSALIILSLPLGNLIPQINSSFGELQRLLKYGEKV
jgi:hypothetical protein